MAVRVLLYLVLSRQAARAVAGSISRLSQSGSRGTSDPPIPTHLKNQEDASKSSQDQSLQRQITYDIYGLGMLILQAIQFDLPVDVFGLEDALSHVSCSKSLRDFIDLCLNSEKLLGTVEHISVAAHLSKVGFFDSITDFLQHEFLQKVCPHSEFVVENVPYHRYRINKKLLGVLHHRFSSSPGTSPSSGGSSGSSTPYSSSPLSNSNNNNMEPFMAIPEQDVSPATSPRDSLDIPSEISPRDSPSESPQDLSPRDLSPRELSPRVSPRVSPSVSPRGTYRNQSRPLPIPTPQIQAISLESTSPLATPPTILLNDHNLYTGSPNKQT